MPDRGRRFAGPLERSPPAGKDAGGGQRSDSAAAADLRQSSVNAVPAHPYYGQQILALGMQDGEYQPAYAGRRSISVVVVGCTLSYVGDLGRRTLFQVYSAAEQTLREANRLPDGCGEWNAVFGRCQATQYPLISKGDESLTAIGVQHGDTIYLTWRLAPPPAFF